MPRVVEGDARNARCVLPWAGALLAKERKQLKAR